MKSMHRTPMTILTIGILTVAGFGGGVVWISKQTPIVRLHPLLKEHFQDERFEVGFRPGNDPRIEILAPAEKVPTVYAMGEVGVWALAEYTELAPKTQVQVCRVRILGDEEDTRVLDIDRELIDMYRRAKRQEPQLYTEAQGAGLSKGALKVLGVVDTGVHVLIEGELAKLDEKTAQPVADRIARTVARAAFLSRVTVTLTVKDGKKVNAWAGRDRPDTPK